MVKIMFKKKDNKVSKGVFSVKVPLSVMLALQKVKEDYPDEFETLTLSDTAVTFLVVGMKLFADYKAECEHGYKPMGVSKDEDL